MPWLAASPAKTSQPPARALASQENEVDSGNKCTGLFERPDPIGSLLRTSLLSALGEPMSCSATWKDSGTPAGRSWWVLSMPAPRTDGSGCSSWQTPAVFQGEKRRQVGQTERAELLLPGQARYWPTPQAFDAKHIERSPEALARAKNKGGCSNLREYAPRFPQPSTTTPDGEACSRMISALPQPSRLNVRFVEWLMGFPSGWCDVGEKKLSRLMETAWSRKSPKRSAKRSTK